VTHQSDVLLRVSAVAKQADVPARTVRFYADAGLLRPVARGENGYRFFGEDAVERVHLLRRASRLGLPLREMKDVMDIAERSDCSDAHRAFAVALRHRIVEVEQQMRDLSSVREQLVDLAAESDVGCTDALCLCRTHPAAANVQRMAAR
jgi:MerR family copper efflux transcriptional regulator